MRLGRVRLFVSPLILVSISAFGQQSSQPTTNATSDPQAVAVVQGAIAALGGATAITQSDTWEFQGQLDGPLEKGNKSETIALKMPSATYVANGGTRAVRHFVSPSAFVPVLVGAVLLDELRDPTFVMRFDGPSTIASKPVNVVRFFDSNTLAIAQIWAFDATTNLPTRVVFEMSAQIGPTKSSLGLVDLSNYTPVSGVLYPFTVITFMESKPPQTLNLKSVTPSTQSPTSSTGGVQ